VYMLKKGTGVVLVICSKCGLILEHYAMGDRDNKKKYSGIPTPSKAIAPYGGVCKCGRELSKVPQRIQVMRTGKFNEVYEIVPDVMNGNKVDNVYRVRRKSVSVVEDHIRASTTVEDLMPVGVHGIAESAEDDF